MNIDKHLLGVLVDAVREGIPGATVSDVPAIIVYAHKGDAFTTVEINVELLGYIFERGGVESVRQHMFDIAQAYGETLNRMIAEGRP